MGHTFGAELRQLRESQGLSLAALARAVTYSKGHLSNVERDARVATEDLAARCDEALRTGGKLSRLLAQDPARLAPTPAGQRPRQLPPDPPGVVGRSDELKTLNDLATPARGTGPRIVVVTGPAGIGKTTLALHWAHRVAPKFPDGVLFADLHGFDPSQGGPLHPAEALDAFLRQLFVDRASIPEGVDARAAMFRTVTSGRQLLLVLDNVATAEQVIPLLPNATRSIVVVTSRSGLPSLNIRYGATYLRVGTLDPQDSQELLRNVLGEGAGDGDLAEIAELCNNEPLALRIAGYRLAHSPSDPWQASPTSCAARSRVLTHSTPARRWQRFQVPSPGPTAP